MSYPCLSLSDALRIARERVDGTVDTALDTALDVQSVMSWRGDPPALDPTPLHAAQKDIKRIVENNPKTGPKRLDRDQIEGKAACVLWRAMDMMGTPPQAPADPCFWRYVAMAHLWEFCVFRQPAAFKPGAGRKDSHRRYVDGRDSYECIPSRMYLRVESLGGIKHAEGSGMAWAVKGGTDMWRSHIHRVKQGEHPAIVRAFVRRQSNSGTKLDRDPLREAAKDLTRTLTNMVPSLMDDKDADRLVGEVWGKYQQAT